MLGQLGSDTHLTSSVGRSHTKPFKNDANRAENSDEARPNTLYFSSFLDVEQVEMKSDRAELSLKPITQLKHQLTQTTRIKLLGIIGKCLPINR